MTPQEFFEKCEQHDWYYWFTDDSRVFYEGQRSRDELVALAKSSVDLMKIFNAFCAYKREDGKKPELKDFV